MTASGLGNSGHEAGELENLFDALGRRQLPKVSPGGCFLSSSPGRPISLFGSLFHTPYGCGCSKVCWYWVSGPLP